MDDEIIYSWCLNIVECFNSTPSAAIIILNEDLESFSSLRSQHMLHWWARKRNTAHPALAPIVRELLVVCATSSPSEYVFSVGQAVVTYKHACLTIESIETLVTIQCWLRGNNTKWYDNVHDEDAHMRVVVDEMV